MSVAILNPVTEASLDFPIAMTRMNAVPKSTGPRLSEATEAVIVVAAAAEREAVAMAAEREAAEAAAAIVAAATAAATAAAAATAEKRKSSRSPEPREPISEEFPPREERRRSPSLRESPSLSPMRLGQKSTGGRHMAGGVYTAARMEQRRARQLAASLRETQVQQPSSPSLTRRRSAAATSANQSPNRMRNSNNRPMGFGGGGGGGESLDAVGMGRGLPGRGRGRRIQTGRAGLIGASVGGRMLGSSDGGCFMRPGSGDVCLDGELVAAPEDTMHGASSHGDGGDNGARSRGTHSSKVSDAPASPATKVRGGAASLNVAGAAAMGTRGGRGSVADTGLGMKNRRLLSVRPEDQPKWQTRFVHRTQKPGNTTQQRHAGNNPVVVPQRPPPAPAVSCPPVAGAPSKTEGQENTTTTSGAMATQGTESGAVVAPTQRTAAPSPQRARAGVPVSGVSPVRRGPTGPGGNASPTRGASAIRGRRVPLGGAGGAGRRTTLHDGDHVGGVGAGVVGVTGATATRTENVPSGPPKSTSHHSDLVELWVRHQQEHSAMHRRGERDEQDDEEEDGGKSSGSGDGGRTMAGKKKITDTREATKARAAARAVVNARRPHGVRTAVAAVAAAAAARKFARKMVPVRRGGGGGAGGKHHLGASDMESVQFDSEDDDSDSDDEQFDVDETTEDDEEDEEVKGKCGGQGGAGGERGGGAKRGGNQKVVIRGGGSKKKLAMWEDGEDSEDNSEDGESDSKRTSQLLTESSKSAGGRAWVGSGDRLRLRGGGGGGGGGGTGGDVGDVGGGGSGVDGDAGGGGGDGKRRSNSTSSPRCRHHHHHHHHHKSGHCHRRHHKHHHHHRHERSVSGSDKRSNSQGTGKTNQRSKGQQTEDRTHSPIPALKSNLRNHPSVTIEKLPPITAGPKNFTVEEMDYTHQPMFDYQAMGEPHTSPGKCVGIRKQYRAHRAARRRLQAAAIATAAATAAQRSRVKKSSKNPMDTNSWTGLAGGYPKSMPTIPGGGGSPYAATPYLAAARMSATATAAAFASAGGGRRRGSGGSVGVRVGTSQSGMASAGGGRRGPGRVAPLAATVAARVRTGMRQRQPKKTFQIGFTRTTTSYGLLQKVAPHNTARDLRVAFAELWQVPLGCLVLYFNGRRLPDGASLWQSGVRANDVLDVFMTAEPGSLQPCPTTTSNFASGGPGGRGVSGVANAGAGGVLVPKVLVPLSAPTGCPPAPGAINSTVSGSLAPSDSLKGSSSYQGGGVRIRLARDQVLC